jgi:flagellar hook-associated protein 3 FlgL
MTFRITDSSLAATIADRISANRIRVEAAQELISSGKRINRPSDDPFGTETVMHLRTSQANIDQFRQNAATVNDALLSADTAIGSYEQLLDRARVLLTQGASDSTSAAQRNSIAVEIDSLRQGMISIANAHSGDRYLFGGTRQDVAPFDSTGVPAATATSQQLVQIEPGAAPIAAGVTAETIFTNGGGTIFASLANAAAALRGTGNPVADKATVLGSMDSLTVFTDQATSGRAQLGASMNTIDAANDRLEGESLSAQTLVNRYESADLAEAAVQLTQADRAYQASLQASAFTGRHSLLDFLG